MRVWLRRRWIAWGRCNLAVRNLFNKPVLGSTVALEHPLARSLVGAWIFNEAYGSSVSNLVSKGSYGSIDVTKVSKARSGLVLDTDATSISRAVLGATKFNGTDHTSIISCVPLRRTNNVDAAAFGAWNSGASPGTNEWLLGLNWRATQSDFYPYFAIEIGSTVTTAYDASQTWQSGDNLVLAGVRKATSQRIYKNGKLLNEVTCGSGSANVVSARSVKLGTLDSNASLNTNELVYYAYMWNRALTVEEIRWMYVEPYAFIAPPAPYRKWFVPATAPAAGQPIVLRTATIPNLGGSLRQTRF